MRVIRQLFPEFERCDVKFPKGWGVICSYIRKEDKDPLIWGLYTREQILEIAESAKSKKKLLSNQMVYEGIEKLKDCYQVYEVVRERLLNSYNAVRTIFEDNEVQPIENLVQ